MKESVAVAKEADAKKGVSPTKSDNNIHRVRNGPERQLGSLRGVLGNIRRDGGKPSVESIATQLSGMSTGGRAPALLALQQTHGNRYVQRVVAGIQAKLKVGQPDDKYEQEADRVAEQVMHAKDVPSRTPEVTPKVQAHVNAMRGGGQPLPDYIRSFFESRFGYDFRQVRVHNTSPSAEMAQAVNARAFTLGQDIVFGAGQYAPGTMEGKRLLAHELIHTIQQDPGLGVPSGLTIGSVADAAEQEADHISRIVDQTRQFHVKSHIPPRIQRMMVEEPAGGCGVCTGPQLAGIIAHQQVQALFVAEDPLREAEEPGSMIWRLQGLGCGRPDLWRGGTDPVQIGEIKPANSEGYSQGDGKMAQYISCFAGQGITVVASTWVHPTEMVGIFEEPDRPPACPQQDLFVNPPLDGVYGYYCLPTFSHLMPTGLCSCLPPVHVPQEQEQEQEEFEWQRAPRQPSYAEVIEALAILGLSVALVVVVIAALVDPEPASKLALAGLSMVMIVALLTMLGMEDRLEPSGSIT
uniref:eCIS core domain-containing protein n=1 Tax=Candidatus Methanophagaceae archaeon ANME-1 ERB6 TaxID=2759912 RepID=A0A7G9YSN6_9EURY|nr:hypothetical protein EDLMLJLI_00013 [Methanosarcinales archaeon ANME-1 ERB6]